MGAVSSTTEMRGAGGIEISEGAEHACGIASYSLATAVHAHNSCLGLSVRCAAKIVRQRAKAPALFDGGGRKPKNVRHRGYRRIIWETMRLLRRFSIWHTEKEEGTGMRPEAFHGRQE